MTDLFFFDDYKAYLNARLDDPEHGGGRGARAQLARSIGCQTAYVAQVLRGAAHFSLEQGELTNEFFRHSEEQGQFFLLLIQHQRAGLPRLQRRFKDQIDAIREKRQQLKNRLDVKQALKEQEALIYYSSWLYAAIHVLVSIPEFQTIDKIADHLQLSRTTLLEIVEFLSESGLIETTKKDGVQIFRVGQTRIHLPSDSPLIAKHHINWRLQAIRSLERKDATALHYSSVVSLSKHDAAQIHERLIEEIKTVKKIIRDSKDEQMQCFSLDFFRI